MAELEILPENWKEKTRILPSKVAAEFKRFGTGVFVDDSCSLFLSIVVVEGEVVYKITDLIITISLLRKFGVDEGLIALCISNPEFAPLTPSNN